MLSFGDVVESVNKYKEYVNSHILFHGMSLFLKPLYKFLKESKKQSVYHLTKAGESAIIILYYYIITLSVLKINLKRVDTGGKNDKAS